MAKKTKSSQKQDQQVQPQVVEQPAEKTDKKNKKTAQKQQPAQKQIKAVGKTKHIKKDEKAPKSVKAESEQRPVEKVEKKTKPAKKDEQHLQVFTPDFYNRVNTFQTFYKEVLELKSSANNGDISDELSTVNSKVREELQTASSKILKDELVTLEQWIEGEQKRLRDEIATVEKCLEQNQKSLENTKAFSVDEVQNQLKPIRQRVIQKQATLENYANLLTRSQGIYQEALPQEQKKEVPQAEEHDDDEHLDLDLQ